MDHSVLIPCHSLEDFPQQLEDSEADTLFASWTVLWHPALLARHGHLPLWHSVHDPPDGAEGRLIVVPSVCDDLLYEEWWERARQEQAIVVSGGENREMLFDQIREGLGNALPHVEIEPTWVNDFYALGFCYLQIELLTRQMRYLSHIDLVQLENEAMAAAQALLRQDEAVEEHLARCFDVLAESRDHFYAVGSYLLDLTLVTPGCSADDLRRELCHATPTNLVLSGATLEKMARENGEAVEVLREAASQKKLFLAGGEYQEAEVPFLPLESWWTQLSQGQQVFERILGILPKSFARRRAGLSPAWPQVLSLAGYEGVLHATLDDGRFPRASQCKSRWQGTDGTALDAVFRIPANAASSSTFLQYAAHMGSTMDLDHVATLCYAHWPGRTSPWYDDMRRAAKYNPVLGKFLSLEEYFQGTDMPAHLTSLPADDYYAPYLEQDVTRGVPDPISRLARAYERSLWIEVGKGAALLLDALGGRLHPENQRVRELLLQIGESNTNLSAQRHDEFHADFQNRWQKVVDACADLLPRDAAGEETGQLVLNATSYARLCPMPLSSESVSETPETEATTTPASLTVPISRDVTVPPMGFAWVSQQNPTEKKSAHPLVAEGRTLRNRFLQVTLHPDAGGIQSVFVPNRRGNRLSQQLAFRRETTEADTPEAVSGSEDGGVYSEMQSESIEIIDSRNDDRAAIRSRGSLVDPVLGGVGTFEQITSISRDSRLIELDITLDIQRELEPRAWETYFAARFAWADASCEMRRSLAGGSHRTDRQRVEAPEVVELISDNQTTTILTAGHPYHRAVGLRMLDTLLVVAGETRRHFRLGIGIDLAHPYATAKQFLSPVGMASKLGVCPAAGSSAWLFHINVNHVVATHWEPVSSEEGKVSGFRARLLETEGQPCQTRLRCFRHVHRARQLDLTGKVLSDLAVDEEGIRLDLGAHEWIYVEAEW